MRKNVKSIIVLCVGLILGANLGLAFAFPIQDTYKGKEVFMTEEAYGDFKYAIGNKEVIVRDVEVLSSNPPIVVVFKVYTPDDVEFAYGEKESSATHAYTSIAMTSVFCGVVLFGLYRGLAGGK